MSSHITKVKLRQTATQLVDRHAEELRSVHKVHAWEEIVVHLLDELVRKCPGFSTREYRAAMTTRTVAKLRTLIRRGGAPRRPPRDSA